MLAAKISGCAITCPSLTSPRLGLKSTWMLPTTTRSFLESYELPNQQKTCQIPSKFLTCLYASKGLPWRVNLAGTHSRTRPMTKAIRPKITCNTCRPSGKQIRTVRLNSSHILLGNLTCTAYNMAIPQPTTWKVPSCGSEFAVPRSSRFCAVCGIQFFCVIAPKGLAFNLSKWTRNEFRYTHSKNAVQQECWTK